MRKIIFLSAMLSVSSAFAQQPRDPHAVEDFAKAVNKQVHELTDQLSMARAGNERDARILHDLDAEQDAEQDAAGVLLEGEVVK